MNYKLSHLAAALLLSSPPITSLPPREIQFSPSLDVGPFPLYVPLSNAPGKRKQAAKDRSKSKAARKARRTNRSPK